MYKVHTKPNQTRTPRLPQDIRKTNKRVSFSTGVIPTTSVSRPQLKSNQLEDRVMPNNSQGKKQNVEDHRRNFKQNRTLVEAARTMLSAAKVPLFFWAEAIAITCFTQNRSLVIPRHEKTPYHIIIHRKPSVEFFTSLVLFAISSENGKILNKMKEKVDQTLCKMSLTKVALKNNVMKENTVISQQITYCTKSYAQKEGNDFKKSFAPVARGVIHQSPRGIFINQAKYAQEILKKHGMTSCDSIGTPMATKHLDADLSGTPVDQTKYRSMVGALMYLTASRPDIVHATCYCARYQAKPTEKHLTAVKRIFRYLKDSINMGLWYPKDTGFELTAFLDSDHAGCLDSRKSTSGGIQFLGGDKLVSWSSKKRRTATSKKCLHGRPTIAISCNPVQHSRTKHIDVRYHFIKEQVEKGIVELFFVGTEYQLADLFTKAIGR
ncbi:hypothetical protein Tco_1418690 [Tanacetum coccineum]